MATQIEGLVDIDGDMVLFQYGTYLRGDPASNVFEFDLTRQLIVKDKIDDDAIRQLSCTLLFDPETLTEASQRFNRWSIEDPDLRSFFSYVRNSPVVAELEHHRATALEVRFTTV